MSEALRAYRIKITGVVQGVGFRPFVYGLATQYKLNGWVINTSAGVDIEIEGPEDVLYKFVKSLRDDVPPLASISSFELDDKPIDNYDEFEIRQSRTIPGGFQPISPDISICDDCLNEINDPEDRRFRYPFNNCTNCGPRFTIIRDIPYDRPLTTMASFEMCPECADEFQDPRNRRFHAQPIACPNCGPQITFLNLKVPPENGDICGESALQEALSYLHSGRILGIKGLGGFHLACDATNDEAVRELRERKGRVDKPFALMMNDMDMVHRHCIVSEGEQRLLTSKERPIVLLRRKEGVKFPVSLQVAPGQRTLGVMLPYTPLHHLLFQKETRFPLVMTSANYAEEPIVTQNDEALTQLDALVDGFLLHDRTIHVRTDDSVIRLVDGFELPIRRSRGYVPFPVLLPETLRPTLAVGGELKNTFCITNDKFAFMSHHVGDMENLETLVSFQEGVRHFEALFRVTPQVLAYDMHPDYRTTRYAQTRADREGIPAIAIQHHHAHIAACMVENQVPDDGKIIGVAFDGTGFGEDGTIWGGEFLIADYSGYERVAHLKNMPLPGGDAGIRKPARMSFAYLMASDIPLEPKLVFTDHLSIIERNILMTQLEERVNTPMTSSMGRLFDVIASLAGIRQEVNYEGQAAIELEAVIDGGEEGAYRFGLSPLGAGDKGMIDYLKQDLHTRGILDDNDQLSTTIDQGILIIDPTPVLHEVVQEVLSGVPSEIIAARFHNAVIDMIHNVCMRIQKNWQLQEVALSGGVFQNVTLLSKVTQRLQASRFNVFNHHIVPPNDAGLALGQVVVANKILDKV